MKSVVAVLLASWSFFFCKHASDSEQSSSHQIDSEFFVVLSNAGRAQFLEIPLQRNSPFREQIQLNCTSYKGHMGNSLRCKDEVFAVNMIEIEQPGKTSKLIAFPSRKSPDTRKFYDCVARNNTPSQKDFRCVPASDEFPRRGELTSPFESSVEGVSIPNFQRLELKNRAYVFRGMAPRIFNEVQGLHKDFLDLQNLNLDAILIFKNTVGGGRDIEAEKRQVALMEPKAPKLKHIPFQWKNFDDFKTPCLQILQALEIIRDHPRIFFHCTVGEDRTGALAAIARYLDNPSQDLLSLFRQEMCEHGFSEGNPLKPVKDVANEINDPETGIIPVFMKIAFLINQRELDWANLNSAVCNSDPTPRMKKMNSPMLKFSNYLCGPSTLYSGVRR